MKKTMTGTNVQLKTTSRTTQLAGKNLDQVFKEAFPNLDTSVNITVTVETVEPTLEVSGDEQEEQTQERAEDSSIVSE